MEKRVTDRRYLSQKTVVYLGPIQKQIEIVDTFKKSFKKIEFTENLEYIKEIFDQVDAFVACENSESFIFLKEIRQLDEEIPFLILSHGNFQSDPIRYIKDNLSHYIQPNLSATEVMYIVEHELKNYDNKIKTKAMELEHKAYLEMLDNTVIISRTDLSGKITYANEIFCEISGYTKEELIGTPHNIVRHPEMPSEAFKQMWDTIESNNSWTGIVKNRAKDGEMYVTKATISPYYQDGQKIGYIGVRNVITDDVAEKRKLRFSFTRSVIEHKKIIRDKDHEIESLKKQIKTMERFDNSFYKDAFELSERKREKLQKKIDSFEGEFKNREELYESRVQNYLVERRENDDLLTRKNQEIRALKNQVDELSTLNKDFKKTLREKDLEIDKLKKRKEDLEDILEHREDQLKKLQS